MRRKSLLLILVLFFGCVFNIIGVSVNVPNERSSVTANASSANAAASNNAVPLADETVTMRDIEAFLKNKKEHYPLSDEFIERYQQSGGGYIDTAKKAGLVVNKELHEPNQKWHFFDSWLYPSIEDGSLSWDESAKSRVYSKLLCPELLLWIYEACGVDPVKVKEAKDVAEQGKTAKLATTTIAKNMRARVAWEDLEQGIKNFTPSASVTLNSSKLQLTVGEQATITATLVASDIADSASWSVIEGEDVVSITPNGNSATVNAIAKGAAKIQVSYGEDLVAVCTVTVKEPLDPSAFSSVKYVITEDLGTGKRSKAFASVEDLFNALERAVEGDGIISSVAQLENIYGGGYGGSGDNAWYIGNVLKLGTTSVNGSVTFELNAEVSSVIITGYAGASNGKIQVGDSASTDWTDDANDNKTTTFTCSDMNVAGKEVIDGDQASAITIEFESASSITIATTNKKPFYITTIEFVVSGDTAE